MKSSDEKDLSTMQVGSDGWIEKKFRSLGKGETKEAGGRSTWRGLGLSGVAMLGQAKFLGEQMLAEPVKAVTGSLDSMLSMGLASPALLTIRALAGPRASFRATPVSDSMRNLSPASFDYRNEAAQRYADETREELAALNQRIQADRPKGALAGFTYDLGTAGVQMAPALGLGLALRSPGAAATAMTLPAAGGLAADGMDRDLGADGAFRRAVPVAAAQFALGRPAAALLTLPLGSLLASKSLPTAIRKFASRGRARVALGISASAVEGGVSQAIQESYDAGVLGDETTLEEALQRIGYAALSTGLAVAPPAMFRATVDGRGGSSSDRRAAPTPLAPAEGAGAGRTISVKGPAKDYGVAFFGSDNLQYYEGAKVVLGSPSGRPFFFMPVEDSAQIRNSSDAARMTGRAPSAESAWLGKSDLFNDIFGISFPSEGLHARVPTSSDAGGWPHYLRGGKTAVRTEGFNGGYLLNPVREMVTPGGTPMPRGSVLFQLGEEGEWIPLRRY